VNPPANSFHPATAETIQRLFRQAWCAKLCKSHRSPCEITPFAPGRSPSADPIASGRHGDPPRIPAYYSKQEEMAFAPASWSGDRFFNSDDARMPGKPPMGGLPFCPG
jgi:hypothetical protein